MQTIRALVPSQQLMVPAALAIAGLLFLVMWSQPKPAPLFSSQCETWDIEASAALAALIADRSAMAEARVGDGLFRLKRARKYCRYGFIALAQTDYDALLGSRFEIER